MPRKSDAAKHPYLIRFAHRHVRLFIAVACGLIVMFVLPGGWGWSARSLTGFDAGIGLYLCLVYILMAQSDIINIRRRAAIQDEGDLAVLTLAVAAALTSLGAIIAQLSAGHQKGAHLVLAISTIVLSWVFTHTIFALHYAHEFYGSGEKESGLKFPDEDEPDYWDFIYFSLVIGMTSQVSDVAVSSRLIRRIVTIHGVIAFFFNATLLALTVNIAASALSGQSGG